MNKQTISTAVALSLLEGHIYCIGDEESSLLRRYGSEIQFSWKGVVIIPSGILKDDEVVAYTIDSLYCQGNTCSAL